MFINHAKFDKNHDLIFTENVVITAFEIRINSRIGITCVILCEYEIIQQERKEHSVIRCPI